MVPKTHGILNNSLHVARVNNGRPVLRLITYEQFRQPHWRVTVYGRAIFDESRAAHWTVNARLRVQERCADALRVSRAF